MRHLEAALAVANQVAPAPLALLPTLQAVWHLLRETGERVDLGPCTACNGKPPRYGTGAASKYRCDRCNETGRLVYTLHDAWRYASTILAAEKDTWHEVDVLLRDALLVWADARQAEGDPLGTLVALALDPAGVETIAPDMVCAPCPEGRCQDLLWLGSNVDDAAARTLAQLPANKPRIDADTVGQALAAVQDAYRVLARERGLLEATRIEVRPVVNSSQRTVDIHSRIIIDRDFARCDTCDEARAVLRAALPARTWS